MNYQGAQEARKHMKVPCEIIRVPQVYISIMSLYPSINVYPSIIKIVLITKYAGWALRVHRQPKWFPCSHVLCLPEVSFTWPWSWIFTWRSFISLVTCMLYLPPQFLYHINYIDLWVRLPILSSIEHSLLILSERMFSFQLVNSLPPFFSWSIYKIGLAAFYWRICGNRIGWE